MSIACVLILFSSPTHSTYRNDDLPEVCGNTYLGIYVQHMPISVVNNGIMATVMLARVPTIIIIVYVFVSIILYIYIYMYSTYLKNGLLLAVADMSKRLNLY